MMRLVHMLRRSPLTLCEQEEESPIRSYGADGRV